MMFNDVSEHNILVLGGGKMGAAIINGWLKTGMEPQSICLLDTKPEVIESYRRKGIRAYQSVSEVPNNQLFTTFLLALKPQIIIKSLHLFNDLINESTCLVSVAAGVTVSSLKSYLPNAKQVVRVMPNTPAMIGKGVMVGFKSEGQEYLGTHIEGLFASLGSFHWVDDENLMHSVTAVSGSGPAYAFYFAECFTACAKQLGLPDVLAKDLALETLIGAAALIEQSGQDVVDLRNKVTSPNGTTQAGLEVLMSNEVFAQTLLNCCEAARMRSVELS
ncbi:pyrroline-5-carboxylate reductase [Marinomonas sp.]